MRRYSMGPKKYGLNVVFELSTCAEESISVGEYQGTTKRATTGSCIEAFDEHLKSKISRNHDEKPSILPYVVGQSSMKPMTRRANPPQQPSH